jgi:dihydroorotase
MNSILIKNAQVVNEDRIFASDVWIKNGRIEQIAPQIDVLADEVIDATGLHLMPGMIDDQVHFREPGLTKKATIASEASACVAGGITSFMEMPNTKPATLDFNLLEEKYIIASATSPANYSFYLGASNDNIEVVKRLKVGQAAGVKVFMGSSTGNMLVDQEEVLSHIFEHSPALIATHCEDTPMIKANEAKWKEKYGEDIPANEHHLIRSREACYKSSSFAVELAKKHKAPLHILHITTADEIALFSDLPLDQKHITAEVCAHHLFFNADDYDEKGFLIKCNPAIKLESDRQALLQAVKDGFIDVFATDHAPHTWDEKQGTYFEAPAGLPLVQFAVQMYLEHYHREVFSLELIVRKMAHAVADRYKIKERGYIREGYWADLILVDLNQPHTALSSDVISKCGWTPVEGYQFSSTIDTTIVSGQIAYRNRMVMPVRGQKIEFGAQR